MSLVVQTVGELAHKMNAQSTYGPFLERFRRVGLRYFQRIERLAIVFHFESYLFGFNTKPDRNLVFPGVGITIRDDVCEKFSQDEGEIVHDTLRYTVLAAEFCH